MNHIGNCFCGAVEIEVRGAPEGMGYCHCRSCRSWSGGPVNAFSLWKPEAVRITAGEANVATKLVDRPFQLVSGFEAYWITAPHRLDLLTPTGVRSFRVEGNILLWQEGDTAFRLETDLPKHQALRLAGLVP
jgi:hypothetical protein